MKKIASLLCVVILIICITMTSFSAADEGKTEMTVKNGDKITYVLKLGGIENPVLGCDFSVYYDQSALTIDSIADFTNTTDEWECFINPDLPNEIKGNWSLIKGVDFSNERNFITVNFNAKSNTKTEISYFVRYLYDENVFSSKAKEQIKDYKFTYDAYINGQKVVADEKPQLETEKKQDMGTFVNSKTGDSKDADPSVPGAVGSTKELETNKQRAETEQNNGSDNSNNSNNNNSGNTNNNANNNTSSKNESQSKTEKATNNAETVNETVTSTTTNETVSENETTSETINRKSTGDIATPSEKGNNKSTSPLVWIIPTVVVISAGGGTGFYFWKKKKAQK